MATQKIQLTEAQLRSMVKQVIYESINEGDIDEVNLQKFKDRVHDFGNKVKAGLSAGKDFIQNGGGTNNIGQVYNQTLGDLSAKDAEQYKTDRNLGYKDIPAAQEIAKKYDAKINKLTQQSQALNQQIKNLKAQKRTEMQAARSEHKSYATSRFNTANTTAKTAANKGNEYLDRRRASLGLGPVQAAGQNPDIKTPPRMNVGQGA